MSGKLAREWPLAIIVAAQVALTLPWLWRTAPFTDEALYLDAGHQVWAHWLHHAPLPDYSSWFSGAPVLYPPIGAVADSIGGLAAARALSLLFMLGATIAVYFTGLRLFGLASAFFGGALFAVTGLIVHYGALATYDAAALVFLAVSMWAAAQVREGRGRWLVACAAALVLANAFKYATLAWDPVIIGLVLLHSWDRGVAISLVRAASLTLTVAILDGGLLLLGGSGYIRGVSATTVFRSIHFGAFSPASAVLWRAAALSGVVLVTAGVGVVLSVRAAPLWVTLLLALFLVAGLIAPLNQARIHELTSLDKNMGFGLVFPVLAAGYALEAAVNRLSPRFAGGMLTCGVTAAVLVLLALVAGRQQHVQFRGPSTLTANEVVTAIRHDYKQNTYIVTPGAGRTEQYYLPSIPSRLWLGVFAPNAATQARLRQRICAGQVSLVLMRLVHGKYDRPFDSTLRALIDQPGRYNLAENAGKGPYITQVWKLDTVPRSEICK